MCNIRTVLNNNGRRYGAKFGERDEEYGGTKGRRRSGDDLPPGEEDHLHGRTVVLDYGAPVNNVDAEVVIYEASTSAITVYQKFNIVDICGEWHKLMKCEHWRLTRYG